jgi:hypothetical protein
MWCSLPRYTTCLAEKININIAQGFLARGVRHGLNWSSVREEWQRGFPDVGAQVPFVLLEFPKAPCFNCQSTYQVSYFYFLTLLDEK